MILIYWFFRTSAFSRSITAWIVMTKVAYLTVLNVSLTAVYLLSSDLKIYVVQASNKSHTKKKKQLQNIVPYRVLKIDVLKRYIIIIAITIK